jgi:lipopolysaccharide/colanic/teichoic acid biosynthesis glycosyltransferase
MAIGTRELVKRARPRSTAGGPFSLTFWINRQALQTAVPAGLQKCPRAVCIPERVAAFVLLILASPVMLLIAVAVKISSPQGPVFFGQERVGLNRRRGRSPEDRFEGPSEMRKNPGAGRPFIMYKYRSMIPNAESHTGPVWATDNDSRVTKVGRVLRQLRLDELPQLINIIRGDMRLIGPRPERPHFVSELSKVIPEYPMRLAIPPGITGLAQIEREYDSSVDDVRTKLKYDLFYVRHRGALMDLKILFRTVEVMLRGRGAH